MAQLQLDVDVATFAVEEAHDCLVYRDDAYTARQDLGMAVPTIKLMREATILLRTFVDDMTARVEGRDDGKGAEIVVAWDRARDLLATLDAIGK